MRKNKTGPQLATDKKAAVGPESSFASNVTARSGHGAWDSYSDSDYGRTPTPPLGARADKFLGVSKNFHENIYRFRDMCVNKTGEIVPRPLRGGMPEYSGRLAVGELQSPVKPGTQPVGNFSPPVSPDAPPCVQKTLANHYPVSRLNPMPAICSLMHEHRAGRMTQDELWRSIAATRHQWELEKNDAEKRVYEQRKVRQALLEEAQIQGHLQAAADEEARLRAHMKATAEAEADAQARAREAQHSAAAAAMPAPPRKQPAPPSQAGSSAGQLPEVDTHIEPKDLRRDGTTHTGSGSSDDRADSVLERLQVLTSPAPSRASSTASNGSHYGRTHRAATSSPRYGAKPKAPNSHRSRSSASARTTRSSASPRSARSGGQRQDHPGGLSMKPAELGERSLYQDAKPGTVADAAVEDANATLRRMMVWAMTARHDRTREVNWKKISDNPWAQKVPTPEPTWGGGPTPWDEQGTPLEELGVEKPGARVGTPLFPALKEEQEEELAKWKATRQRVKTPPAAKRDVIANLASGDTLYFVHAETGDIRMTWDMEPDSTTDEEGQGEDGEQDA